MKRIIKEIAAETHLSQVEVKSVADRIVSKISDRISKAVPVFWKGLLTIRYNYKPERTVPGSFGTEDSYVVKSRIKTKLMLAKELRVSMLGDTATEYAKEEGLL